MKSSAHFNHLPARYAEINDAHDILRDISQVHRFIRPAALGQGGKRPGRRSFHGTTSRIMVMPSPLFVHADRERLFSNIAGCLTAAGLNILSAEIVTRNDGIILDTFCVTDARTGLMAIREERDRFELLLHKVLTGAPVDLPGLIAKTKAATVRYTNPSRGNGLRLLLYLTIRCRSTARLLTCRRRTGRDCSTICRGRWPPWD